MMKKEQNEVEPENPALRVGAVGVSALTDNVGFLNRSTFKSEDETLHDFRTCKARWGWKGLVLNHLGDRNHHMRGIGRGINEGDIIITDYSGPDAKIAGYIVKSIKYHSNPRDMFDAQIEGPYCVVDSVLQMLRAPLH